MSITNEFKEAVESGDKTLVRVMLKNSMLNDVSLKSFGEELAYAESAVSDLYDEHDGESFDYDMTKWDKDLLDNQMVKLVRNFSHERIEYISSLIRHLYADKRAEMATEAFIEEHSNTSQNVVGAGLVVGGTAAVIAGVALATGKAGMVAGGVALGGIGAACIVAGGIILYKNLK